MFRQLGNCLILCCALFIAANDRDRGKTDTKYKPAQRIEKPKIKVKHKVEYRFGGKSHSFMQGSTLGKSGFMDKIKKHAAQRVECSDAGEIRNVFDKPLPIGWLYGNGLKSPKEYFDTSREEKWVLPNVHCNADRVLTAISWMRSKKTNVGKKMVRRFRVHNPPTYDNKTSSLTGETGVFCDGWEGWLFEGKHYQKFIETTADDELFRMVNVFCRQNRVTYMDTARAGDKNRFDTQAKNVLAYPFANRPHPPSNIDGIGCSWQGWLLKDGTGKTWKEGDNSRWSYEKYYAIDKRSTGDKRKFWMHGRVINPYCSKEEGDRHGVVTRIRAYCFYSTSQKNTNACVNW